jgi:serralysin
METIVMNREKEFKINIHDNKNIEIQNKIKNKDIDSTDVIPKVVFDKKWPKFDRNSPITWVSYTVEKQPSSEVYFYHKNPRPNFFKLNVQQEHQLACVLQAYSDVANIEFIKVKAGSKADIIVMNYRADDLVHGYAFYPDPGIISPILINEFHRDNQTPNTGNYGGKVLAHEVGHALGLRHTHDLNFTDKMSVMSYLPAVEPNANYGDNFPSTPQMLDILAIQYLYGANLHTRTGDTVYGFNSNSRRDHFIATRPSDALIFCVWDAGGNDTFDFSGFKQNQLIKLTEGCFSNVGGLTGNVSIAWGVTIENALGGSGDDIIIGNAANNMLSGGNGADKLYGGKGADIFCYRSISDSYTISSDTIYDFKSGEDTLDFSGLISPTGGIEFVDKFSAIGASSRMQMKQHYNDVTNLTYLLIDFRGQGEDFNMKINFTGKHQFTANDFIFGTQLIA